MDSEPISLSISTLSKQRLQRAVAEAGGMTPLLERLVIWIARQPECYQQQILEDVLNSTCDAPVVYTEIPLLRDSESDPT